MREGKRAAWVLVREHILDRDRGGRQLRDHLAQAARDLAEPFLHRPVLARREDAALDVAHLTTLEVDDAVAADPAARVESENAHAPTVRQGSDSREFSTRGAQLAALIADNPDDADAYRAYGDWLEEQGDARRNQLLGMHVIRDRLTDGLTVDRTKLDHLDQRLDAFFAQHRDYFWGPLAKVMPGPTASRQRRDNAPKFEWRNGFIYKADLKRVTRPTMDKVLAMLLQSESGQFLVELVAGWPEDPPALIRALAAHAPRSLRRLDASSRDADLSVLWPAVPRLHELVLNAAASYGVIDLPALHTLRIEPGHDLHVLGRALAESRLPHLRTLVLDFRSDDVDQILRVVAGSSLAPQLAELQLRDVEPARGTLFEAIATTIER